MHEFLHIFQGRQTYVGKYRDYTILQDGEEKKAV